MSVKMLKVFVSRLRAEVVLERYVPDSKLGYNVAAGPLIGRNAGDFCEADILSAINDEVEASIKSELDRLEPAGYREFVDTHSGYLVIPFASKYEVQMLRMRDDHHELSGEPKLVDCVDVVDLVRSLG